VTRFAGWFALVLLLGACGPQFYAANYTSFVDPAFRTRPVQAQRVLVMAPTLSLAKRQSAEAAMAEVLRESGLAAVTGLEVFPPTRGTPTTEEVLVELRARGLDGAVVLWNTAERTETSRSYRTVTDTELQTRVIDGERRTVRVEVQRQVPYTVQTPVATYSAQFVVPQGPIVWTAEGHFSGGSYEGLAASAGTGAIAKLQADGVVANPAAQPPGQAQPAPGGNGLILPGLR